MTITDHLDLRAWARQVDDTERTVLVGLNGPVLDIGCGPGRLVAELSARGIPSLGIDIAPLAAELSRARGAAMLGYSVFDQVPGEGRWPAVLLFDGNIGIGGDPSHLLRRVRQLLGPGGVALVEVAAPTVPSCCRPTRIELAAGEVTTIDWAVLNVHDAVGLAGDLGFVVESVREHGDRWFIWLRNLEDRDA